MTGRAHARPVVMAVRSCKFVQWLSRVHRSMTVYSWGRTVKALLVASRGGHLSELRLLASRLPGVTERTWVTFRGDQAGSLLHEERVLYVDDVNPRSPLATLSAYPLAATHVQSEQPDLVVSTGASIALPYLAAARRARLPAIYIESAARGASASLTGRLTRAIPGVKRYQQHDPASSGWRYAGSVFDPFARAAPERPGAGTPLRVLVTLGTMPFPFDRLVSGLLAVLDESCEMAWQLGSTRAPAPLPGIAFTSVAHDDLARRIRSCDVLVTHAGVGTILTALESGKVPIVVPRRVAHGEHVDDHQVITSDYLSNRGLVIRVEAEALTLAALREAACGRVSMTATTPPLAFR